MNAPFAVESIEPVIAPEPWWCFEESLIAFAARAAACIGLTAVGCVALCFLT
jgi:hypothetical protein